MKKELLEKILSKLIHDYTWFESNRREVISAIESELAKPDPRPVAVVGTTFSLNWCNRGHMTEGLRVGDFLYMSPPSREPLSADLIVEEHDLNGRDNSHIGLESFNDGVLFAEKHHKIGQKQ